ncbi:MAG: hypothetical protein JO016_06485 [Actinobacteria bacterium]|nr:hypothetical protein [Actinomycetota bacterium]
MTAVAPARYRPPPRAVAVAMATAVLTAIVAAVVVPGAVDLDGIRADLAATVHTTLQPAHSSVWTPGERP